MGEGSTDVQRIAQEFGLQYIFGEGHNSTTGSEWKEGGQFQT